MAGADASLVIPVSARKVQCGGLVINTTEGDQQAGYQCEACPAHGFHSIAFRNRLFCRFALLIVLFDLACAHAWFFAYADERDRADE